MNQSYMSRFLLIRTVTLLTPLLILLLPLLAHAQNPQWQAMKGQQLFTFDVDCAEKTSFPSKELGEIIRRPIQPKSKDQQVYGNLAVPLKLIRQGPTVFFIPTVCGSTDCTWLLYSIGPVKSLGQIKGNSFITYQSSTAMPTIVVTSIVDTFTTAFSTYSFDSAAAEYKSVGDRHLLEVDKDGKAVKGGNEIPTSFRKPKVLMPQCKNMIQ